MPSVRVEPAGIDMEVGEGESVMAAAQRCGYRWPTVCGGEGACRVCYLVVLEGADSFSPVTLVEREAVEELARALHRDARGLRLACQAKPTGAAVVYKPGVRPG
jgi:ferredoxin, 2Fe-2S